MQVAHVSMRRCKSQLASLQMVGHEAIALPHTARNRLRKRLRIEALNTSVMFHSSDLSNLLRMQ